MLHQLRVAFLDTLPESLQPVAHFPQEERVVVIVRHIARPRIVEGDGESETVRASETEPATGQMRDTGDRFPVDPMRVHSFDDFK